MEHRRTSRAARRGHLRIQRWPPSARAAASGPSAAERRSSPPTPTALSTGSGFRFSLDRKVRAIISLFIAAVVFAPSPSGAQQREPELKTERAIEPIADGLYRFHAGPQHSLFLVTSEGIVVVDPLGLNTALWLNEQFAARFPGVPVKFVVFTHHHAERAGGAGVFKGAITIGHKQFRGALTYSSGNTSTSYEHVTPPQRTFSDRYSFEIGGKTIDLVHTGSFHSRDSTVVLFKSERMLLAVDPPPVGKVPFSFGAQSPAAVVRW